MGKNNSEIKLGAVLSYAQMFLNIIIGLVYTPIMIRLLGSNEYGLYNMVASTISTLTILNLGFNSSYIRFFSKYKNNGDNEGIFGLNGIFLIIFSVIGVVALVCGLFFSCNLSLIFDKGLTVEEYATAKVLMVLLTVNLTISFPMTVFTNIISANEKFIVLKLVGMLKSVLSPIIHIPVLLLGYGSVGMVVVSVVISVIADAIYIYYVLFKLRNRFVFQGFDKDIFGDLFAFTAFIALNSFIDQVNWNIDKLVLGRFKGTESVAIYSVGFSLYSYYQQFSTSISGIFIPRIHAISQKYSGNELKKEYTSLFTRVGRIQFLILGLIATGLIFYGKLFISLWAGEGYERSYYVMLLLVIPATIALTQNLGIEIQRAQNKHKFRAIAYSIMALVNLFTSIILGKQYGAVGCAVGTAVSLIVANGFIMNFYYQKKCNIDVIVFWREIIKISRGLIIPVAAAFIIDKVISFENSFVTLVLSIIIYTITYVLSMWLIALNQDEKNLVVGLFGRMREGK